MGPSGAKLLIFDHDRDGDAGWGQRFNVQDTRHSFVKGLRVPCAVSLKWLARFDCFDCNLFR